MRTWRTAPEAADILGIAERTVRDQLAAGALRGEKIGSTWVVEAHELERYRAENLGRPGRRQSRAKA